MGLSQHLSQKNEVQLWGQHLKEVYAVYSCSIWICALRLLFCGTYLNWLKDKCQEFIHITVLWKRDNQHRSLRSFSWTGFLPLRVPITSITWWDLGLQAATRISWLKLVPSEDPKDNGDDPKPCFPSKTPLGADHPNIFQ